MPSKTDWEAWLAERPIGVLATTSEGGMPHAAPVEVVTGGGKVYVWCESDSVKAANARRTGLAALTAYKGQAGVLVRGSVLAITKGTPEYESITQRFLAKYDRTEEFGNDLVLEITPAHVAAWD